MSFKKKLVLINGRKVYYWEKNPHKKEIIILLHGFPGTHEGLIDLANGLENFRLIIPDLPSCGLSESLLAKPSLENYSQWLFDFLKILSINNIILVGHSFGSRIGLVFTSKHPERVKRLVLITPVVKVDGLIARFVAIEYEIAKILPSHLRKAWLSNSLHRKISNIIIFKSTTGKRRQKLVAMQNRDLKHFNPQINIQIFDEFYRFSLIPVSKQIKTKSLIIAAELDEIAPLDSVIELSRQLSNSDFITMKNCGHIVVAEKPLTTASIVLKWLND